MNRIRIFTLILLVGFLSNISCTSNEELKAELDALKDEVAALKAQLDANKTIEEVMIDGNQLILVFADESTLSTTLPAASIPTIGENGNWWIDGVDLGSAAVAQVPTVGENGNWWVDGADTGVAAQGTSGTNGTNGDGVESVEYDQTTGILTITLTDATVYQFTLYYEFELKAAKLEDLNGEYLLSTIYNGDMPFVSFSYNADNRISDIIYYTSLLNEPVEYLTLHREYNASGDIISQSAIEYATANKAVMDGDAYPDHQDGDSLGYVDAFNEIDAAVTLDPNILVADAADLFVNASPIVTASHIYFHEDTDHIIKYLRRDNDTFTVGISQTGADTYLWTPEYDYDEDTLMSTPSSNAYLASEVTFDGTAAWGTGSSETYSYYPWAHLAMEATDPIDDVTTTTITDYFSTVGAVLENPENINTDYKALFANYNLYTKGDEISSYVINYDYDGEDFLVNYDAEDVLRAVVVDGKMTSIEIWNEEDMVWDEYLELTYDIDDKLINIGVPSEDAPDVVQIAYDGQGNPIQFGVNSSVLSDNGNDEIMAFLGLAYSQDVYDPVLGMVVEEYIYPDEYTPMLSVTYDFTMKNYMNHTFTAANPLMTIFDQSNAIKEIAWAGHGSATVTEYLEFNEGGYPTRIKSYAQISADAVPIESLLGEDSDVDVSGYNIPFNVSVAMAYRLEYIEKQ